MMAYSMVERPDLIISNICATRPRPMTIKSVLPFLAMPPLDNGLTVFIRSLMICDVCPTRFIIETDL